MTKFACDAMVNIFSVQDWGAITAFENYEHAFYGFFNGVGRGEDIRSSGVELETQ